ncbi:hypothetical protein BJ170DRAFT_607976 [Xylariales sp. AK1849]|nr:hypothetical protein BJ170DRAFT_607976 [Xylariales sp. AK1849]
MPIMTPTTSIDTNLSNASFHSGNLSSPRYVRSRTQSISSDRPSTISPNLMSPPLNVSPEAAFIAGSAASQIVTNDHDSHSETWYDQVRIEPSGETALVSDGALQLANNFVDQLLFNIISIARSTSLAALRLAVSEVLKPKLAKDAINQADEELREYLGGDEVEDLVQSPTVDNPRDWDLELVWKRTRLRCMVYSSLGDMEEEDEDYFMEQEHLSGESDDIMSEVVSPAVAIFLTSILEYMGEQVLVISGQAAFNRLRAKYEKELKRGTRSAGDVCERIVIEELDMERVALDRTLGRLWRSWKKRIRSPVEPNYPRGSPRSATHSRPGSTAIDTLPSLHTPRDVITEPEASTPNGNGDPKQEKAVAEAEPFAVPLPVSDNDVAEIEVPGLVSYSDDEESDTEEATTQPIRPKSLMLFATGHWDGLLPPNVSQTHTPVHATHRRANSLPTPSASPYASPKPSEAEGDQARTQEGQLEAEQTVGGVTDETSLAPASVELLEREENDVSPLATEAEAGDDDEADASSVSPVSKIVTGVAAVGTAAVAGVAAIIQGAAPQTVPTPMEDAEIYEFVEEPEILTSSRVSIGGRSSPSASESGRPISLLPTRSNSVRSVRVIEVPGPRSPGLKSRNGSLDVSDYQAARAPSSLSRESSISTPPIVEEGADSDASSAKPRQRNAVIVPPPEEYRETKGAPAHPPTNATNTKVAAPASAPASTPASSDTKVTILSPPAPGRSFLDLDTKPEVPQKSSAHQKQQPLPTLPEKSSSRPAYSQGTPEGMPAVDRPQQAPRGSPESPKASRPKQNTSPSSSSPNKHKARRTSEDSVSQAPQNVARNFEELLHNNQTLQYTLTPENMRDIDSNKSLHSGSPIVNQKSRISEDVNPNERSRSSSLQRSVSVSRATGLSSHPLEYQTSGKSNGKLSGPVPRAPPVSMSNYSRSATATQARDARIPRESVADFADFIRSTGPSGPPGTMSSTRAATTPPSNPTAKTASIDFGRPRQGSVSRARLQARDATISASNESSDLIDFIRRGPPSSSTNNPRIPRNVAPFRTTMDSDQMQMLGAGGGKAVDARLPEIRHSQASTNLTENSVPSSINSQSALLTKTNKPTQYANNLDDEDMLPKRKQRRVRDPYVIDLSDEDDDLDLTPQPKPKKEESLIDFLKNYEPPGNASPPQPFVTSQMPQAQQGAPRKKASAPNLMTRLRSAGGGGNVGAVSPPNRNGYSANESRALSSSQASNARGPTPRGANNSAAGERLGSDRVPEARSSVGGRVLMKRYEPRDAVSSSHTRTSDLAQFLRDSEPPPTTRPGLPSPAEDKSSSGLSRMFERRKKPSVY